ncbi:P450 putative-RELATED [Salix viminalis]|uniref:P450 putative-RELATED n=1 Tax=Salix viminalis TaxID=40686 RepID=A0A9Q0TMZ5_SALVM|nr:P450 putative-RELATED [Salix viminalis]
MLNTVVAGLWSRWWDASNEREKLFRTVLITAVAMITVFWFLWNNIKPKKAVAAPSPPGPRGLPLVGYLPFLGYDLHKKFTELAGRLWTYLQAKTWKQIVRLKKAIRDVYNKIGSPVDFGELAYVTSINAVLRILLGGGTIQGEKWTDFVAQFRSHAAEMMVLQGKPNVSDLFPVLARFDLQGIERQSKRLAVTMDQFLQYAIKQRSNEEKSHMDEGKDFLQILLDLNKHEDPATSITMDQVKAILMDIFLGGTDTTTTMIEWTMARLMQHQEVRQKVYQELQEVVGSNNFVEEFHLPKLRYLSAVIKETFRLHPALPLLVPRFSRQSCMVGGYIVPKGTTVLLNVYAIHRDPDLWENPLEFRPERFLNADSGTFDYSGNNFQYLPFGSGRRVCAGIPLAEKMLMLLQASLLHSFEWKLPAGGVLELSDRYGIVIKKMEPLIVIPSPRLCNLELY